MADSDVHAGIALCGKCKIKVVNAVKCKTCSQRFHYSCAKLTKNVVIVDGKSVICCEKNNSAVTSDETMFADRSELHQDEQIKWEEVNPLLFKYIIHDKDALIASLRTEILLLNQQLDILRDVRQPCKTARSEEESNQNTDINTKKHQVPKKKVNNEMSKLDRQSSLRENKQTIVDKELEMENNDPDKTNEKRNGDDKYEWKTEKKKRNNKPQPIVGSSSSPSVLKAVPKMAYIHIYRLMPNTDTEEVTNHLKPIAPEVTVQKLNSRYPSEYSSFQLTVNFENREAVMNPAIWPSGTKLNRFFHLRPTTKPST
ncbi:hypothetical protein Zmor_005087 [Zophobas morio]|uniref:Uncharacterized protein n=1 Tax=Zophobas morio TaxID=2755281 RepID=A0AA38ISS7_9CUCU|nr:hypothetical protein Zmor_005087 [Zophobas morio]